MKKIILILSLCLSLLGLSSITYAAEWFSHGYSLLVDADFF